MLRSEKDANISDIRIVEILYNRPESVRTIIHQHTSVKE